DRSGGLRAGFDRFVAAVEGCRRLTSGDEERRADKRDPTKPSAANLARSHFGPPPKSTLPGRAGWSREPAGAALQRRRSIHQTVTPPLRWCWLPAMTRPYRR